MAKGILGRKIGMTQIFSAQGDLIPVTIVQAEPNVVLQVKTVETDGYNAVQLGFADAKEKNSSKAQIKHAQKANTNPKRFIKEIAGDEMLVFKAGQEVKVNIFTEGEIVDVTGTSKGKGYAGVIKRHNFHRGPMAHGSGYHRGTGSMGSIDSARIFKNKKMPGRLGGEQVTIQNLQIVKVDVEKNIILVRGNVPGAKKSYVMISNASKAKEQPINPAALV
ncbi:MAG: 50S ribosomal protein L3 [Coprobacillus sp.]|nr:50S ribosomal protein L3 [Coprobacillus sp.]MDY4145921.1 50S ribosomal protein L3 [Bacilli bacterium]OLA10772.1 MAG: 50S ribosomal protein L3 [Coprobacillus sp. 28_7]CCY08423.1 50S ribosomal protein L3 [Coprobacillus sp. CAG:698]